MSPTFSTPRGTPLLQVPARTWPAPLVRLRTGLRHVVDLWMERQDHAGIATLAVYLVSGASAAAALAYSTFALYRLPGFREGAAWWFQHFSDALWAAPIALGFASRRPLPRLLAGLSIAFAAIFYGGDWLPTQGGASMVIKTTYVVSAIVLALPALLRQSWHRSATRPNQAMKLPAGPPRRRRP
jgi:hypothetical protein